MTNVSYKHDVKLLKRYYEAKDIKNIKDLEEIKENEYKINISKKRVRFFIVLILLNLFVIIIFDYYKILL